MLNSFVISKENKRDYNYNYNLHDDLVLNYIHKDLFNLYEIDDKSIICYGYCFDVRDPEKSVSDTLKNLLEESENLLSNIKYLNGHYLLLFRLEGEWQLVTDAVSMTPVYVDSVNRTVTTENDSEGLMTLNGFKILSLNDFTVKDIEVPQNKLKDDRLERIILDLVMNQYKYFKDKRFILNFRRNKMNKALISILHPVLFDNMLNLREDDDITKNLSGSLAREYKMTILNSAEKAEENGRLYTCNVHLMNYNYYMDQRMETSEQESIGSERNDSSDQRNIEYNLQHHLRYRNEKKDHLLFDPFNVPAIQERIYTFSDERNFDPLTRIIRILHPSIDFHDFSTGETLLRKFNQVKKKYDRLSKEMKNQKQNHEFLSSAEAKGIEVSENLDGKVMDDGITFYPATELISKDEVFEVTYKKQGNGMILVESYFNNPKNAHRIKVEINGELNDIDEYLEGKFLNVKSDIRLKMRYERDYQTASWQRAGKMTIREII